MQRVAAQEATSAEEPIAANAEKQFACPASASWVSAALLEAPF